MYDTSDFRNKLASLNLELTDRQCEQFIKYYEMLVETNKVMNLTAITEFNEVIDKHFVDSVYLGKIRNLNGNLSLIDVGTGAGFPGIPLKIMFPQLKVTLLDSLNKRINFLNNVIDALGLEDIEACHGRAEDFGHNPRYREKYDLCVSRAVANMATLSEYCMPFVKVGGEFIPYKSGTVQEELDQAKKAVKILGGQSVDIISYGLPDTDIERTMVVISKNMQTKKTYPRKAGKPSREPLK